MLKIKNIAILLICCLAIQANGIARVLPRESSASSVSDTVKPTIPVPFFCVLTDAINKAIAEKYKTKIRLIAYPSQGNLMWYYQNPNGIFNQGTFDYISARVSKSTMPCTAELSSSGGFANAYSLVISSLYYNLSSKDKARLSSVEFAAQPAARDVTSTYENTYGVITETEIDLAQLQYGAWIKTKLDYVIDVVAGGRWSGRETAGLPPLSYTQMANAQDLQALLPDMPANGAPTVAAIQIYLNEVRIITTLSDSASNGAWTIRQLNNHTGYPNAANGGMKTVNPNTGEVSAGYQVGYNIANPIPEINADLTNTNRSITIVIHIKKEGPTVIDVYTAWNAKTIDTITYALPDSVYVDMYPLSSGQSDQMIEVVYYGFTMLTTGPLAWNDSCNTGWYFAYPLNQAIRNDTQDVTGYKFASWPPPYDMRPYEEGGNFGFLSRLLICNYQKIGITMGYSGSPSKDNRRPARQYITVPLLQQTAYVIGGSFSFPDPQAGD